MISQKKRLRGADHPFETSIAEAATQIAESLRLRTIVTGTVSGNTAKRIASFRPRARIAALTPQEDVARRLSLVWGVDSVVVQRYREFEALLRLAEQRVVAEGLAASGDTVALTSGMPVGEGGTNVLKLHVLP